MQNKIMIFSEPFVKNAWLKKQAENNLFYNVTFQNGWRPLTEVKNHYPFFIDEHFDIQPDLSKRFLPFFDYIDLDVTYEDDKINQLQTIKKALIKHHMLQQLDLSNYQILQLDHGFVPGMIDIETKDTIIKPINSAIDCFKAKDTSEQVYAVFELVVDLLNKGIDINNIKILNTTDDDDFQLKKLFKDANIPIFINKSRSIRMYPIFQTIKSALLNKGLAETKRLINDLQVTHGHLMQALIRVINRYPDQMIQSSIHILVKELEKIKIKPHRLEQAVDVMAVDQIKDLDHHYLMMNFVDERFPKKAIDHDYLTDDQKAMIGYPTTDQVNQYRQMIYGHLFDGLKHLQLFYPATLVDETRRSHLKMARTINVKDYQYRVKNNSYLKDDDILRYGTLKHLNDHYQMVLEDYPLLHHSLKDQIQPFDHQFSGINKVDLDQLLVDRFSITGAKIEKLNLCPFQYFLAYLLRLDDIEPNHYLYFGNQIHEALEHLVKDERFDYEQMVKASTTFPEEIDYKKDLYQEILIENIERIFAVVKDFHAQASYQTIETEKKISRKIHAKDRFHLKGIIDKLMIDEKNGYYAIIDYKYSGKSFSMKEFDQGLKLQLPFYAYLYNDDETLKPSGIFFRQTGMNKEKSGEIMDLRMDGVFIDDALQMKRLDPFANHIKGLRYKNDGEMYQTNSKISESEFQSLLVRMEAMIIDAANKIEDGKFEIKPILTIKQQHQSISCQYCPFGHICYSKNKHIKEVSREVH